MAIAETGRCRLRREPVDRLALSRAPRSKKTALTSKWHVSQKRALVVAPELLDLFDSLVSNLQGASRFACLSPAVGCTGAPGSGALARL